MKILTMFCAVLIIMGLTIAFWEPLKMVFNQDNFLEKTKKIKDELSKIRHLLDRYTFRKGDDK